MKVNHNPTFQEAIDGLPQEFVNRIVESNDIPALSNELKGVKCPKKRLLINARLENLNHTCSQWDYFAK